MNKNQSQIAYRHLRKKFLNGAVEPGSRLSYGSIGREIGISATPVREAVGQLANEGFVKLIPQLGAVVRKLSQEEAVELYELREALETFAVRRAAERISERQLLTLEENLNRAEELVQSALSTGGETTDQSISRPFHTLDLSFHGILLEAAGNRRMLKIVADSHILMRIFEADRHSFRPDTLAITLKEHRQIASAVSAHDAKAAEDAMRQHILNSLSLTLNEADKSDDDTLDWLD